MTKASLEPARYLAALAQRPKWPSRQLPRTGLQALLAKAGHPEREVRCIHIAGSKGKGTTALMLEAMLQTGGRRTGVFTSPHLERWNERIRLDGNPVTDTQLAAVLSELQPHVTELHAGDCNGPEFFEVLLVAALCLFRRAGIDEAVIEAGIGVRFDATRVIRPIATALTSVEREHTALLGNDIAEIARDKAAVARRGVPLVIGELDPAAYAVVTETAAANGAPLHQPEWRIANSGARVVVDEQFGLPLAAPCRARAVCTAVAFGCLQALELFRSPEHIGVAALDQLVLPGRQEVLAREPLIIADAAHTRASFAALAETLSMWSPPGTPLDLVLSCSGARDLHELARPLLERARTIVLTRADATRSADPAALAAGLQTAGNDCRIRVIESPREALAAARDGAAEGDVVCATGSVYMAGAARRFLHDISVTD